MKIHEPYGWSGNQPPIHSVLDLVRDRSTRPTTCSRSIVHFMRSRDLHWLPDHPYGICAPSAEYREFPCKPSRFESRANRLTWFQVVACKNSLCEPSKRFATSLGGRGRDVLERAYRPVPCKPPDMTSRQKSQYFRANRPNGLHGNSL